MGRWKPFPRCTLRERGGARIRVIGFLGSAHLFAVPLLKAAIGNRQAMKKASDYRQHADESRATAKTMSDQRDQLLERTATWERLAEERSTLVGRHPELAAPPPAVDAPSRNVNTRSWQEQLQRRGTGRNGSGRNGPTVSTRIKKGGQFYTAGCVVRLCVV
jgi:hypothetical protein